MLKMAQQDPSQPPPSDSTTENPIAAVGRKVKSVLTTHQRPTIRIHRNHSSTPEPRKVSASPESSGESTPSALPQGSVQQGRGGLSQQSTTQAAIHPLPSEGNGFTNRFRTLFGRGEHSNDSESYEHEYDPDMVDLLDVMGAYN